jgi:DNA gyrase/topoisomerase IV subunit B
MSNYKTKEQLKAITKHFSELFDIKLHRVRHKVAQKEGFKNHESHLNSLPEENKTVLINKLIPIEEVKKRPSMYGTELTKFNLYTGIFDILLGSFIENSTLLYGCHNINVEVNTKTEEMTFSLNTDEIGLSEFTNKNKMKVFEDFFTGYTKKYNENMFGNKTTPFYHLFFVNALSNFFIFKYKDGQYDHLLRYEKGELVTDLKTASRTKERSMEITLKINSSYIEFIDNKNKDFIDFHSKEINQVMKNITFDNEKINIDLKVI